MSQMSRIYTEIEELLLERNQPKQIAKDMKIPLEWVYAVMEISDSQNVCNPAPSTLQNS